MANPTPYERAYSFTNFQSLHPSDPLPGNEVDAELDAIAAANDNLASAIEDIRRSDGALKNGIVTPDSLSTATNAMLAAAGATPRGAWLTLTSYAINDIVTEDGATYMCTVAHASGTFATDLAAGKWTTLSNAGPNQSVDTTATPAFAGLTVNGNSALAGTITQAVSQNSVLASTSTNASNGNAAAVEHRCSNGTSAAFLRQYGTNFTTAGIERQNGGFIGTTGNGGLTLNPGASGSSLYLAIGGTTQTGLFSGALGGSLVVGAGFSTIANMDATGGQVGASRGFFTTATNGLDWDSVTSIHGTGSTKIDCVVVSGGVTLTAAATSWASLSDETKKTGLAPIANGLAKVNTLRAVTGRYISDQEGMSRSMLIAQDVRAVLPEAVSEDPEGILSLRYSEVIPLLVAAIKELSAEVDALKNA